MLEAQFDLSNRREIPIYFAYEMHKVAAKNTYDPVGYMKQVHHKCLELLTEVRKQPKVEWSFDELRTS